MAYNQQRVAALFETVYGTIDRLLQLYEVSPNIHTIAPFITVLRVWRDAVNQMLEPDAHDDHVSQDDVHL